jgi:hypothetical protein
MKDISISYCVTVCDELEEFTNLIQQLSLSIDDNDEIIVLVDETKGKKDEIFEIYSQTIPLEKSNQYSFYHSFLNNDFSQFKNQLIEKSSCDYILQIDADELLSESIYKYIKLVLEDNDDIDVFDIPRHNIVDGITNYYLQKWGWRMNESGFINYPDYQTRLFKNNQNIRFINKVHERLNGYKRKSVLPSNFFIIHNKNITKQEKQNKFYEGL